MPIAWPRLSRFISSSPILPKPITANAAAARPACIQSKRRWQELFAERCSGCGRRDIGAAQALAALRHVRVVPVFTAHPTEVSRRTVLQKRRRIAQHLESLDRLPLSGAEAAGHEAAILSEITSLWQTDEVRLHKPSATDEVRIGLDYYPVTLFDTVPRLYAELAESFSQVYGEALEDTAFPELLDFGSWIGGDRDGNPLVSAGCTADALQLRAKDNFRSLHRRGHPLIDELSSSVRQVPAAKLLRASLQEYESTLVDLPHPASWISETEVYRRFLNFVAARLRYASDDPQHPRGYRSAAEFERDLSLVRQSLFAHHGHRLVQLLVDPLLRKVRTFGFRLHTLDIRQHSRVHAQALAELAAAASAVPQSGDAGTEFPRNRQELLEVLRGVAGTEADLSARRDLRLHHQRYAVGERYVGRDPAGDDVRNPGARRRRRSGTDAGAAF